MSHRNAPLSVEGRRRLIERCQRRPIAHVAAEMGISRACASKWVNRYRRNGQTGLHERSSTPHRSSRAASGEVVARIETWRELAQLVGRERAAELLFTGEVIDAERAERIGVASRVVDDEQLLRSALDMARRIAANPPLAVAALEDGLRKALDPDWTALGGWVSETLGELFGTEGSSRGGAVLPEKREPRYIGR